ncbi:MAG: hypothetical protein QNL02_15135, partial [Paracoccaceae bacterium]
PGTEKIVSSNNLRANANPLLAGLHPLPDNSGSCAQRFQTVRQALLVVANGYLKRRKRLLLPLTHPHE